VNTGAFPPDGVLDPDTGLIRYVAEISAEPGEPPLLNYSAKMSHTVTYLPLGCYDANGGAGLTHDSARRAALGEAVERYCASVYFRDELPLATYAELSTTGRALAPGALALFHERQREVIRYAWFEPDTPICWVATRSLTTGEEVFVPASSVFVPYFPFRAEEGELTVGPGISTGLASARSASAAMLGGLLEVVERDAFMITWLARLPVPRIDPHSGSRLRAVSERLARPHLRYVLSWMATDVELPAVLCTVVDESYDPPLIACGGAAHLNPETAAIKALVEAAQTREWARVMGHEPEPRIIEADFSSVTDFEDHVFLYGHGDMGECVSFLLDAPRVLAVDELPAALGEDQPSEALDRVHAAGWEVLAANLTTVDAEQCGYHVVKTIVPCAQQLEGDHSHRLLGGRRLYEVPRTLGYESDLDFDTLNPDPHPYP
jgi:ribosomal protein S12 methylthiotransferase accessory factor